MSDPELQSRGRLVRSLGTLREMLPGSFVERRRKCGKPNCRCTDGNPKHLHVQFLLSVLTHGKLQTVHLPARLADEARTKVELHHRFQQAGTAIAEINLRRWLRRKQEKPARQKGSPQ